MSDNTQTLISKAAAQVGQAETRNCKQTSSKEIFKCLLKLNLYIFITTDHLERF